ncbi:hypothetical protein HY837_04770 [archaeon]|nr:hypothetical protein [archaeon]
MNLTPYQEIKEFMNAHKLAGKKKRNKQEERYISDQLYNLIGLSLRMGSLALMGFTCSESLGITNFGALESAVQATEAIDFSRTMLSYLPVEQARMVHSFVSTNALLGALYTFGCLISTITIEQPQLYKDVRELMINLDEESNESNN